MKQTFEELYRARRLADAYEAIARANHYMTGLTEAITDADRLGACGILVERQNACAAVARAKRHLIEVVKTVTDDELIDARGILVERQNAVDPKSKEFAILKLALDLVEAEAPE